LLKNKIEFVLKFEIGREAFTKLVSERVEREVGILQIELENTQNQLQRQKRKFARLQARRQGKTLLDCEYNKPLGCLGAYQCDNCRLNYPAANQVQTELKGGAC